MPVKFAIPLKEAVPVKFGFPAKLPLNVPPAKEYSKPLSTSVPLLVTPFSTSGPVKAPPPYGMYCVEPGVLIIVCTLNVISALGNRLGLQPYRISVSCAEVKFCKHPIEVDGALLGVHVAWATAGQNIKAPRAHTLRISSPQS